MLDIYDYLRKDHEKVMDLFDKFEAASTQKSKQTIFERIAKELLVHAKSEEKSFYALLDKRGLERDTSSHAKKEHKEAEKIILNCLKAKRFNEAWEAKVFKLRDAIKHHVREEEGKMFEEAHDLIDEDEAKALRKKMQELKPKIPLPSQLRTKKKASKKKTTKKKAHLRKK